MLPKNHDNQESSRLYLGLRTGLLQLPNSNCLPPSSTVRATTIFELIEILIPVPHFFICIALRLAARSGIFNGHRQCASLGEVPPSVMEVCEMSIRRSEVKLQKGLYHRVFASFQIPLENDAGARHQTHDKQSHFCALIARFVESFQYLRRGAGLAVLLEVVPLKVLQRVVSRCSIEWSSARSGQYCRRVGQTDPREIHSIVLQFQQGALRRTRSQSINRRRSSFYDNPIMSARVLQKGTNPYHLGPSTERAPPPRRRSSKTRFLCEDSKKDSYL